MKRDRFIRDALLVARRATAWAHDATFNEPEEDMSPDACARFAEEIRQALRHMTPERKDAS